MRVRNLILCKHTGYLKVWNHICQLTEDQMRPYIGIFKVFKRCLARKNEDTCHCMIDTGSHICIQAVSAHRHFINLIACALERLVYTLSWFFPFALLSIWKSTSMTFCPFFQSRR